MDELLQGIEATEDDAEGSNAGPRLAKIVPTRDINTQLSDSVALSSLRPAMPRV